MFVDILLVRLKILYALSICRVRESAEAKVCKQKFKCLDIV